jgi:hypothetical protein
VSNVLWPLFTAGKVELCGEKGPPELGVSRSSGVRNRAGGAHCRFAAASSWGAARNRHPVGLSADSKIVRDLMAATHAVCGDPGYVLVHLVIHYAFEGDVAVLDDNMDGRNRPVLITFEAGF